MLGKSRRGEEAHSIALPPLLLPQQQYLREKKLPQRAGGRAGRQASSEQRKLERASGECQSGGKGEEGKKEKVDFSTLSPPCLALGILSAMSDSAEKKNRCRQAWRRVINDFWGPARICNCFL